MIAKTSLEAYEKIKLKLPAKRKEVLEAIEKMDECCNKTLAWRMGWPVNCVSPRTGELRAEGLIVDTRKKKIGSYNHQFFRSAKPEMLF